MKEKLISLARQTNSRKLFNWSLEHFSFAIPVKRLRETRTLLAFHHPQPSHKLHILILPKRPYASLMDVPIDDGIFLQDLIETVQSLVREYNLENRGYRLITNGGAYQDVPHLHFHLISDEVDPDRSV
jgi:histidine triad (HIT) family protein